jgi:hypothetical protein
MSVVLWGAQTVLAPLWAANWRLLVVVLLVAIGGGTYGAAALLLKAVVPAELKGMLRRRKTG